MYTDPISITYGEEEISLPRISATKDAAMYVTPDGEFEIVISHTPTGSSAIVHSITLSKIAIEPTEDLFTGSNRRIANSVTFQFETDISRFNSKTELPEIREALETLIGEGTFLTRLLGGES